MIMTHLTLYTMLNEIICEHLKHLPVYLNGVTIGPILHTLGSVLRTSDTFTVSVLPQSTNSMRTYEPSMSMIHALRQRESLLRGRKGDRDGIVLREFVKRGRKGIGDSIAVRESLLREERIPNGIKKVWSRRVKC